MTGGVEIRLPRGNGAVLVSKSPDGHAALLRIVSDGAMLPKMHLAVSIVVRIGDCSIAPTAHQDSLPWVLETLEATIELSDPEATLIAGFLGIETDGELT